MAALRQRFGQDKNLNELMASAAGMDIGNVPFGRWVWSKAHKAGGQDALAGVPCVKLLCPHLALEAAYQLATNYGGGVSNLQVDPTS